MPSFAFSPAELSYLHTSLSSSPPVRPDSRTATQFRPLSAETTILPSTNGSAHLSFSDGSEAIVGIKLEVEKTPQNGQHDEDDSMEIDDSETATQHASPDWVTLTLTLPGLRDDDASLVFLEQMLREPLISPSSATAQSLQDALIINKRWHWHIYVDVVLISPFGLSSYPLPLLSLNVYLALCDTRVPRLKSQGEEDPVADDDWEASGRLYGQGKRLARPSFTLLVLVVGGNMIFDPSREELAVADAILAVSVGKSGAGSEREEFRILAVRMIETPARDTMKGVPASGNSVEGQDVPGVWRPKLGGVKRSLLKEIMRLVMGEDSKSGVAKEVVDGLEGFLITEASTGG
jgi:exosome complex component RRP42